MDIARLALLGGLLGLDGTAVGQFMISRPLVAGALAGVLSGNLPEGALVGMILELYLLVSVPSGGARFPEASTATVVAVACAAPFSGAAAVPLAVAAGLVWGQVGGATVDLQRRWNGGLVPRPGASGDPGRQVPRAHLLAIGVDFLRGAVVTGVGIVTGRPLLSALAPHWPLDDAASLGLLLVGGAVSAGILLNDLGGFRRRKVWFTAGLGLGLVGSQLL